MPIHYDLDDHVVTITIDRPARRNALDLEHFDALAAAWKQDQPCTKPCVKKDRALETRVGPMGPTAMDKTPSLSGAL